MIEQKLSSSSFIVIGGAGNAPTNGFISNEPVKGAGDRGPDRNVPIPGPRIPYVGGSSFGSSSGGGFVPGGNGTPEKEKWISDSNVWDHISSEQGDSKQDEDESEQSCLDLQQSGKLNIDVDFFYTYDKSGNIVLWVPNNSRIRPKRQFFKVEFDQTCAHLHHARDLGIKLPRNFDMNHYRNLSPKGKIQYAKEHLSPEIIINYQNAIGKSMVKGKPVTGFAGRRKRGTHLHSKNFEILNKPFLRNP